MSKKRKTEEEISEEITTKIDLNALTGSVDEDDFDDAEDIDMDLEEGDEDTGSIDLKEEKKTAPKKKKKAKKAKKASAPKKEAKKDKEDEPSEEKAEKESKQEAAPKEAKEKPAKKTKAKKPKDQAKEKKEPKEFKEETGEIELSELAEAMETVMEEAPKAQAKGPVVKDPSPSKATLRRDASLASVAMQQSMDSMAKQWGLIKSATGSVSENFEQVAKMMDGLSENYSQAMKDMAKMHAMQNAGKPSPVAKVAVALSALALILSGVSLSFSQSIRHLILSPNKIVAEQKKTIEQKPIAAIPSTKSKRPVMPNAVKNQRQQNKRVNRSNRRRSRPTNRTRRSRSRRSSR